MLKKIYPRQVVYIFQPLISASVSSNRFVVSADTGSSSTAIPTRRLRTVRSSQEGDTRTTRNNQNAHDHGPCQHKPDQGQGHPVHWLWFLFISRVGVTSVGTVPVEAASVPDWATVTVTEGARFSVRDGLVMSWYSPVSPQNLSRTRRTYVPSSVPYGIGVSTGTRSFRG